MKKITLIFASCFLGLSSFAQIEYSSFTLTGKGVATTFATDYQSIGINPSNLGWGTFYDEKKVTVSTNEFAYSLHSEVLGRQEMRDQLEGIIRGEEQGFTYAQKLQTAHDIADKGITMNLDYMSFGAAYQDEKFGGLAFRINDNAHMYSKLGNTASELLFLGKVAPYFDSIMYVDPTTLDTSVIANYANVSSDSIQNVAMGMANAPQLLTDLIEGTDITMYWTREYNLSYGRKIFGEKDKFELFAGVGAKIVQGIGLVQLQYTGDQLVAFSSLSPKFGIDYGAAANNNPTTATQDSTKFLPQPVGKGFGMDFGASAIIGGKLRVGASVNNIGSINWEGNVYTLDSSTVLASTTAAGMDNYTMATEDDMGQLVGQEGIFEWGGEDAKKISLPTTVRLGASLQVGEKAHVGVDMVFPGKDVPGSFNQSTLSIGGDIRPLPWLMLNGGMIFLGNNDFSVPMGITLIAGNGSWECGVASRDMHTFIAKNGSTLSLSMGFMRFRF